MSRNFADRLTAAIEQNNSRVVVGLDPQYDKLPEPLRQRAESQQLPQSVRELWAINEFCTQIIEATGEFACAFKPQIAFFERYGGHGLLLLERLLRAHRDQLWIMDCKRSDIGSTSEAYAAAYFSTGGSAPLEVDAVTHNPYLGHDSIAPYLPFLEADKGMFLLVKTSNPSSGDFQDLLVGDLPLAEHVAQKVDKWGEECLGARGYSSLGMVVGATYPETAQVLRRIAPRCYILVPGLETQGGQLSDAGCFTNEDGGGAVFNFSRAVIYAYQSPGSTFGPEQYASAAREAAAKYREALNTALKT
jgi:orotidine-5'-phosphate decarboxylase